MEQRVLQDKTVIAPEVVCCGAATRTHVTHCGVTLRRNRHCGAVVLYPQHTGLVSHYSGACELVGSCLFVVLFSAPTQNTTTTMISPSAAQTAGRSATCSRQQTSSVVSSAASCRPVAVRAARRAQSSNNSSLNVRWLAALCVFIVMCGPLQACSRHHNSNGLSSAPVLGASLQLQHQRLRNSPLPLFAAGGVTRKQHACCAGRWL